MARSQLRTISKDRAGNVISGATVNIYQPGTTTAPIGTMYSARTGGSVVTNPRTSTIDGEVEVWLDTPQTVDVTATSGGSTVTEVVEVFPDAANIPKLDAANTFTAATTITGVSAGTSLNITGAILWGGDTNLYRGAANELTTDDIFRSYTRLISLNLGVNTIAGYDVNGIRDILFTEQGDPAAPGANDAKLYAKDNGAGKTQLVVRFSTGAVQVLATEP